ncbi:MAG: MarR family transcriptional regulator [Pseudomonadota bacterium]
MRKTVMAKAPKIFLLLQRAHAALFRAADRRSRAATGLSTSQQGVLFILDKRDGAPISEIAEVMLMSKSSISGLIDRMEAKGFVRRAPSAEDGRVLNVFLEPKGAALIERSLAAVDRYNARVLAPFDEAERKVIERFLLHVAANAEELVAEDVSA